MAATGEMMRRPARLRWRPVFSPMALLSGLLFGFGTAMLQQQFGMRVLTRAALVQMVVLGLVLAIVVPSIGRAIGVRRANRAIEQARRRR